MTFENRPLLRIFALRINDRLSVSRDLLIICANINVIKYG